MTALRNGTEAWRSIRLCVDSYDDRVPRGRFLHPGAGGARPFRSLADFLIQAEELMDKAQFPQSFTAKRSFAAMPAVVEPEAEAASAERGERGTFVVRLLFRQHASWQGEVTWLEGNGVQSFRSVLELVLLLDSALSA